MDDFEKKMWEILVPRFSNGGVEYSVEYHSKWDDQIRKAAGGLTILRTAKGHWVSPGGRTFVEEMIPVRVYCSEAEIERIMDVTLSHYDQEAVFAYAVSTEVKIKHRSEITNRQT